MKKTLAGISIFILATLACNILNNDLKRPSQSQFAINTAVAQTMEAVQTSPLNTLTAAALNTPTSIPLPSPSATPMVVIKAAASCRSGPAETYKSVVDLNPNQREIVLGKDPTGQYWLIQISSGTCWIAATDGTFTGNAQTIPEVTPPPSGSQDTPAPPKNLSYNYYCSTLTGVEVTLTWVDVADNETGYRVYRNGSQIAELSANSTSYKDDTSRTAGSTFSYSVEAFNGLGASNQVSTSNFRLSGCTNP